MAHTPISAPEAPQPIGPYSVAARDEASGLLFCSGQTPIDLATGHLVDGDVATQTRRVFDNLRHVLEAAGATFAGRNFLNWISTQVERMPSGASSIERQPLFLP